MSWLSATDNEDYSQVITEKVTFSSFWFLKDSLLWGAKRDEVITCKRTTRKYIRRLYKTAEKRILLLSFNVALFTELVCLIPRSC